MFHVEPNANETNPNEAAMKKERKTNVLKLLQLNSSKTESMAKKRSIQKKKAKPYLSAHKKRNPNTPLDSLFGEIRHI